MTGTDFLQIVARRKWVIATTVACAVAAAIAVRSVLPAEYTATATLRTPPATAITGGTVRTDTLDYVAQLQNTYARLATTSAVKAELARRLGLSSAPDVAVSGIPGTELMQVRAKATSADGAAAAANALATLLIDQTAAAAAAAQSTANDVVAQRSANLRTSLLADRRRAADLRSGGGSDAELAQLESDIRLKEAALGALLRDQQQAAVLRAAQASSVEVVSRADPPSAPVRRSPFLFGVLGLVAGLAGGLALALLLTKYDDTLEDRADVKSASNLPILAHVASFGPAGTAGLNGASPADDSFRRLAAALLTAKRDGERMLLITSAVAGEGKSAIATSLSATLARGGRSVLLVDANLEAPTAHRALGLSNEVGLSQILEGRSWSENVQIHEASGLAVITAGRPTYDTRRRLASEAMDRFAAAVNEHFDVVVFDGPAVLDTADPLIIGPLVDGVVLVVAEGATRRRDVEAAAEQLDGVHARLLGVVTTRRSHVKAFYASLAATQTGDRV